MRMFSRPDFTISEQGISTTESIIIGGVRQSVLIQTEKPGSPILLFIHGGPSMPIPGVSNRGQDYALVMTTRELVKQYTVVFWDQRGTGKSYSKDIAQESMNLKQMISDALEVTDYLRGKYKQDRIHLAAHSWGTVIALSLVNQYPDRFYTYAAFSQITNWVENDKLSYQWLLKKANEDNNRKALEELRTVGEPPYTESFKQWSVIRKWQFKYNSMFYNAGDKGSATFMAGLKLMLRSPDYKLVDIYNTLVRGFKLSYSDEMVRDLNSFDFFKEAPWLQIPVLFIHGSKEQHVMPELVERYYETVDAPRGKRLLWSDKSSHAFHLDDARENERRLIEHMKEFGDVD
jgi:pimeloyl-ACP methyl ester carboxylesterase